MKSIKLQVKFLLVLIVISLFPTITYSLNTDASIFYNDACHHCAEYTKNELNPLLEQSNITVIEKDYVNNKEYRKELNELNKQLEIPFELQGHLAAFIDNKIILEGHVPEHILKDILNEENQKSFDKIIIFQDEMENARSYKIWAFKGEIKEYLIDTPISEYLNWFEENKENLKTPEVENEKDFLTLLPLVLSAGLLDGINPCAFAVILFLITFLFTIRKTKANILKMGLVYIAAIYAVYLLIGLGILQAIHILGIPHFMGKLAAYLIILLGVINLINYTFPNSPIKLKIPTASKHTMQAWINKATIPAALVLGILVGICVFPCSGAIYVAIIGFLSSTTTYLQAVIYLLIYNVMFVLPLIIILLTASNKSVTEKMMQWERSKSSYLRLLSSIVMIVLGIIILVWFV